MREFDYRADPAAAPNWRLADWRPSRKVREQADAWAAAEAIVDQVIPDWKREQPRDGRGRYTKATPPAPPRTLGGIAGNLPPWLLKGKSLSLL
jgi:hypothetical protein